MNLRIKTLVGISIVLVSLVGGMFFYSENIISTGFNKLEQRETENNINRVRDTLAAEVENLSVKMIDWSAWDDAYNFVASGDSDFVKSNLQDSTLIAMKLNVLAFYNNKRELVWGRDIDFENSSVNKLSNELQDLLQKTDKLHQFANTTDKIEGVWVMGSFGPALISAQPLVTSNNEGPIHGSLIAVRKLNQPFIDKLMKVTHLNLELKLPSDMGSLDPAYQESLSKLKDATAFDIRVLNESRIAGYSAFLDVLGNLAFYVRLDVPRDVHAQGQTTIWSFMVAMIVVSLLLASFLITILERLVLGRLSRLVGNIHKIESSADLSLRVNSSGTDEISNLGRSMNSMLGSLEKSKHATKLLLDNAGQGFFSLSSEGLVNEEYSRAVVSMFGVQPGGKHVAELMGQEVQKWNDCVELLFNEAISFGDLATLCPKSVQKDGRTIELEYRPVRGEGGKISHILVVATDVTELLTAKLKTEKERQHNLTIIRILTAKKDFIDLLETIETLGKSTANIPEFKRTLHTLKGGFGFLECRFIAAACHEWENKLSSRTNAEQIAREAVDDITNMVKKFISENNDVLGFSRDDSKLVKVSSEKILQLIAAAKHSGAAAQLIEELESLMEQTAPEAFQWLSNVFERSAEKLDKEVEPIVWEPSEPIVADLYTPLFKSLVHVARNAADHGIESPDDREMMGKPRKGQLTARLRLERGMYCLTIRDDGAGADIEKIIELAQQKNIPVPDSEQEQLDLLFAEGFSSKVEVSEFSGRGVGLDAVRTEAKKLGGGASITNNILGEGLEISIWFKKKSLSSEINLVNNGVETLKKAA